jgi:uncharacterized cupin superfamily protein
VTADDVPTAPHILNIADAPAETSGQGRWAATCKGLTPALDRLRREQGGARLGMNVTTLPPGHAGCPFHTHAVEDEVFFVLAGRGVLRYGDTVTEVKGGDCIECPAGTGIAHQFANPFDGDFVYLGVGLNDPNEVNTYPDSGKVSVRRLKTVGVLAGGPYWAGEDEPTRVFEMAAARGKPAT